MKKFKLVKKQVQTTITSIGVTPTVSVGNMFSVIDYNSLIKNDSKKVNLKMSDSNTQVNSSKLVLRYKGKKNNKYYQ